MKIGIITYDFYPFEGGAGRYFYEVFRRITSVSNDLEVFVISPCLNVLENHIQVWDRRNSVCNPLTFSAYLNLTLDGLIKKYRFDFLNLHVGPGGFFLIRKPKVRIMATAFHTYHQQLQVYRRNYYPLLQKLEAATYRRADSLITTCSSTFAALTQYYGIDRKKVQVVPCGVNTEHFKPLNLEKIPGSILYVGRLAHRKGLSFLLSAHKLVTKKILNAPLIIVGQGPYTERLKQQVRHLGLESNVRFLGWVPEQELPYWYNRAEVFVLPSELEGFGLVATEAMACGTPVIGTKVSGVIDLVKDERNGLLVKYGDAQELAGKILRLLEDGSLRTRISNEGLKTVREKYCWQAIIKELCEVYQSASETDSRDYYKCEN